MKMTKKKMEISELCLILMGEEWTGKSSAGNTMLGQNIFPVDNDTEHVMQSCGIIEGRKVTVVDTPGWNSECSPDEPLKILEEGQNSVSLTCQGFHIFLLTIPISQNQKWNQKLAQRLSNALSLFNNDIWKHTMLLFTRGDLLHFAEFEGYLKGNGQPFQNLVEKCESRYHVLNNHKWDDHKQVKELLEKIEQMVQNDSHLLQLVTTEKKVGTESSLEDYMFKSQRPEETEPPDLTDQRKLLRSNSEVFYPIDMQGAALKYYHIQDLDTESTPDHCSESPPDINSGLARRSDCDSDTESSNADLNKKNTCTEAEEKGIDRIADGDKGKNKRHVQHFKTPQTWEDSKDLNVTCSFYILVSSHHQSIEICILQDSVCFRKIKPSCQTDWIFFTVYGDDITWLFIILYLLVKYVCMVHETYVVSKETGDQTMNTLISGFTESTKDIQGPFNSLLWQIANNKQKSLDEKITECSKMENHEEIPQHSTRGEGEMTKQSEDEVKLQHSYKDNEEDEDEIPQHGKKWEENEELSQNTEEKKQFQQIEGANEEKPHQSKKGDKKELPQHDCNKDAENILQQKKRVVDTRQHSIKKEEKQIFQNNKRNNEVAGQERNADKGKKIFKLEKNSTGHGHGKSGNVNNNAVDNKNGDWSPNIVERCQQSPKTNALSLSKGFRKTEKTLDIRKVEFGGTRKSVRSQGSRGSAGAYPSEHRAKAARVEDTKENGGITKMRRNKSLERFTAFSNAGEEDTKQHLGFKKIRRAKSLERFITLNKQYVRGRHSRPTGPDNNSAQVLCQMPFLMQPSHIYPGFGAALHREAGVWALAGNQPWAFHMLARNLSLSHQCSN